MVVLQKLERREPDDAEVAAESGIELPLFPPPVGTFGRRGQGKGRGKKEQVNHSHLQWRWYSFGNRLLELFSSTDVE